MVKSEGVKRAQKGLRVRVAREWKGQREMRGGMSASVRFRVVDENGSEELEVDGRTRDARRARMEGAIDAR